MSTPSHQTRATITEAERQRRRAVIEEVRHSSAMEGARSTDEARADQDAWVDQRISVDELVERADRT